jgi:hypothetical protein
MSFKDFSTAQDAPGKNSPADKPKDAPAADQPEKAPAKVTPAPKS